VKKEKQKQKPRKSKAGKISILPMTLKKNKFNAYQRRGKNGSMALKCRQRSTKSQLIGGKKKAPIETKVTEGLGKKSCGGDGDAEKEK